MAVQPELFLFILCALLSKLPALGIAGPGKDVPGGYCSHMGSNYPVIAQFVDLG